MAAIGAVAAVRPRRSFRELVFRLLVAGALCAGVSACFWGPQRRPAGFLNLGLVRELAQSKELFFSDLKILLRRDDGGFYAMSTACTYDLSPLFFSEQNGQKLWRSQFSASAYDLDGRVAHGPAKYPLPYYRLQVAPGTIGGAADTLFVAVGIERDASWRLPVPPAP